MNHQRQGVIFDVEDQPDILTPLQNGENSHLCKTSRSPFVAEQESPLQRPRPPETRPTRPGFPPERGPRKRSFPNRWSHRLSAVILNRSNDFTRAEKNYSCKDVACVVLVPSILLSLVLIGVCTLFIYLHLLQEYHAEIDKLKSELQAARDKDGVFLPKEHYEEQIKAKEFADKEIQEKTLLLKAMEEELEKFKEIIAETSARLEETIAQKEKTQRALDCTRTVLHKTEGERAEQAHLVTRHIETECKLKGQAQLLLTVSDEATKDLRNVHDKLDRKRTVEDHNEKTLSSYKQNESQRHSKLEQLISGHVQVQSDFCGQARTNIDTHAERRAEERSQLTQAYTETVGKLIETMGEIERVTSEHMYSEQSWVENLLKRVRNEADSATNDFHAYLVDSLLTVSTKILASLQLQDKTVQDLSNKLDKNFAGLTQKLDSYLSEQGNLRQKKSNSESDFFAGLERRNAALSSAFKDDSKATEEYIKKSNAFNEQMMSLLKAKAKEEEAFLAARNATMSQAASVTSATSEATTSAQQEAQDLYQAFANLETGLKNDHGEGMQKLKAEKASALDEINQAGQSAAKATAQLRSDAESFAQKAKDQWANHYARTEVALREKSDKSSGHVTGLQTLSGNVRKIMLEGQSKAEDTIETWRRVDDKSTRDFHESASAQCSELSDFGVKLRDEIRAADNAVANLLDKQLKRDVPTGRTPSRVTRDFPSELVQGTPDEIRLQNFRKQWNLTNGALATKMDFDNEDPDLLDSEDLNSEAGSSYDGDSVFSNSKNGSASLSRQDSGGSLTARPASKKTSRTNLSEASADTGIIGDIDNKENVDQFQKPKRKASKLKQPEAGYSATKSRSSSQTRQKLIH